MSILKMTGHGTHTHVVTNTGYKGQDIQFQRRFLQFTLNPILISIRHLGHRCKIHFRQLPMPLHIGYCELGNFSSMPFWTANKHQILKILNAKIQRIKL